MKELYPKVIRFLSTELNKTVLKQYLDSCSKNALHNSEDSCDALLNSLNSHLKDVLMKMLVEAEDIPIFTDEAMSAAQKEMTAYSQVLLMKKAQRWLLSFCH